MKAKKLRLVFLGGKTETYEGTIKDLIEKYSSYDIFYKNKLVTEKSKVSEGSELLVVPRTTKA